MKPSDLLTKLQAVQAALAAGNPLKAHGAAMDRNGLLILSTPGGPLYLWAKRLPATVRNLQQRVQGQAPLPPAVRIDTLHDMLNALQAAQDAPRDTIALPGGHAKVNYAVHGPTWDHLKREAAAVYMAKSWGLRKLKRSSAPARAVGNFSTADDRERTLKALRDNLRTAMASGHEPLIKVMRAALDVAEARPVDPRP